MSARVGLKEREHLYRMIISQLFYDGYQNVAVNLASAVHAHPPCAPSDRLSQVVSMGLRTEEDTQGKVKQTAGVVSDQGIDLETQNDVIPISPEAALYETCYVTAHKAPCRVAAFHPSGLLAATGSEDSSIKILDVERMFAKSQTATDILPQESQQQSMENHPVIRTLYDHAKEVTWIDFHPHDPILASGGRDFAVKFFDYSKPSVKKSIRTIGESHEVTSLHFHPAGQHLLVGTLHKTLRLYDVETAQCFVAANPADQHNDSVTMVRFAPQGNIYATCSVDGSIKIWDGVSSKCINTFTAAHEGEEVCSVFFSKNAKYILSSGKDSLVRLWELSASRCLIAYTGAGATGKQQHRTQAVFNHTEDYVLFPDEKTTSLCCWDSRNAERQRLLSLGHNGAVQCIVHSPNAPAFLSCSDDNRARFWFKKPDTY